MLMLIALTFQTCHVETLMAGTVGWDHFIQKDGREGIHQSSDMITHYMKSCVFVIGLTLLGRCKRGAK